MPERAGWTGTQVAVLVILLVVTNAVTASVMFFAFPAAAPESVLVVYHPWSGSERDLFLPVLEDFTDRTGIKVTDVTFRQEDLQLILPAQFEAERTPADVIFMASGFIRDWGIDGHAVDMSGTLNEADFLAGALDPISSGSAIYGGAFTGKVKPGFWYKNDLFTSKGWDTTPANFAEFQALLADIATDMTPIVSTTDGWPLSDLTEHFIATYGGAQMHKDLVSGAAAFTDADVKAVFTDYLVPLITAGYFDSPVEWTAGVKNLQDGDNALYFQGSWLPTMSQITDTGTTANMRAMALPGGVADQGVVFSVDYVFVPTYTTRMADAQALFDYLMSVEGQEKQIEQGGHFATNVNADPSKAPPTFSGDLIAGKEILADLDDTIGGSFQTAFWAQLLLLWADPSQLDAVLAAIEGAR
ncbi:MAG: extracellular solute-binding protein [Thermoplasmata archaeon]